MTQLEQEYDEQADMIDQEDDHSPGSGPGPYPQNYAAPQSMQPPMQPAQNTNYTAPNSIAPNESGQISAGGVFNGMNHLFHDPYDPMMDTDPFGLTASMHFPTMYDSR